MKIDCLQFGDVYTGVLPHLKNNYIVSIVVFVKTSARVHFQHIVVSLHKVQMYFIQAVVVCLRFKHIVMWSL